MNNKNNNLEKGEKPPWGGDHLTAGLQGLRTPLIQHSQSERERTAGSGDEFSGPQLNCGYDPI